MESSAQSAEAPALPVRSLPAAGSSTEHLPAWYVQASAEFSALVTAGEIARIAQYAAETEARARHLEVLWAQDPLPRDDFLAEAVAIIEQSDHIEDNVATLKNTVVRFVRAARPGSPGRFPVRSRTRRRHLKIPEVQP